MSVRRPSRRYIGFRFRPERASRREVARAIDAQWAAASPPPGATGPRLLVCEPGAGILVVPTPEADAMRRALSKAAEQAVALEPVVTSGTIITVKARMGLRSRRRR